LIFKQLDDILHIFRLLKMSKKFVKPQIVLEVTEFLKQKGHTCPTYIHSTKILQWCHQDVCKNIIKEQDMKKRNDEALEFANKLIKSGPKKCIKLYQFNTLFAFFIYKKGCRPNRKTILKCIKPNTL